MFAKTVFVEEDPSQTCRNYPTSEFESYSECDDKYMKNEDGLEKFKTMAAHRFNRLSTGMENNRHEVSRKIEGLRNDVVREIRTQVDNVASEKRGWESLL